MAINKKLLGWSFLLSLILSFLIPSGYFDKSYKYGFPFSFITIHQQKANSAWFGSNFFSGNEGLSINPLVFLINIIVLYLLLLFVRTSIQRFKSNTYTG